jgi:glycosyltransferase involved in cell wall biosynthesis
MSDKKIKVLHLITRMIVGGASENTMLTAQLLNKNKYEVDVISGPQIGNEGSLFEECKKRCVKVEILPELVREINPLNDLMALIKLIYILRRRRYDIIHTHSSKAGILGRIAAYISNTPLIFHTVHGWSFHNRMSYIKKKIYVILERFTAKFTNKLITVTDFDIKKGLNENISRPEKYITIHSSIEIDKYRNPTKSKKEIILELGLEPNKITIGTISRMSKQKAPLDFLMTAKIICEKFENVQFLFVGDGPLRHEVEIFIREKNLDDKVFVPGIRYDIPNMLYVMDFFVLNSLWEGLPRVFSQAMAAGLPIVATRVDGAPEAIIDGKNGFLVDPGKPKEMAKKIELLLNNSELMTTMGNEGRKMVDQSFNVISMVKDIENIYYVCFRGKQ